MSGHAERRHGRRIFAVPILALALIALIPVPSRAVGGLVAAFAFDEGAGSTVADASGNGNTGTISGATWTAGEYNYGLAFNGTSARVDVPDAASLHLTSAMTLEAWVKPSVVTSNWRDVVYKGNDNYYLMATSTRSSKPVGGVTIAGTHQEAVGAAPMAAGTFAHVAATYDGSTIRLYVNGAEVGSKAATGSITTSTNPLQIGGDSIYGQYFAGTIDEIRIYNTALTQSQIQADMATAIGSPVSDTVPPTTPANLGANAVSSNMISLNWTASTDNIGVTGYLIERCLGSGCSSFAQIGTSASPSFDDGAVVAATTYRYRVRATDAASNLSGFSNIVSATTPSSGGATGLVAAYAFDEGSGTVATDLSGNGNAGVISNGSWTSGKFNGGLSFNGTTSRVTVPDATSLRLDSGMTLEAWVNPTAITSNWRDVIYKGNDNYYLMATSTSASKPAGGALVGGAHAETFGSGALPVTAWTHLAVTYDGSAVRLYVNGTLASSKVATGSITTSANPLQIGGDSIYGQYFAGTIDEVRVYNSALTQAQIQTDMATPVGSASSDTQPPTTPTGLVATPVTKSEIDLRWAASTDNVGVVGYKIFRGGTQVGSASTYTVFQDIGLTPSTSYSYTIRAYDASGNTSGPSSSVNAMTFDASRYFQNDVLATGFDLPTNIEFLPDGRMLVVELAGKIKVLPPPYTQPDPTPFLQISNIGSAGVQQGIYDIVLDPNFTTNHYYYVFYTLGTPNHDRLSRFTANASLTGTVSGSEFVLYEDPQDANAEHHGGAVNFGNDGKLYFTTGEHFQPSVAQSLTSPRGKVHRINKDGTIPTDNPFYDGAGPNVDSIWARGLRNPFRAYYDAPTGRLYIGNVGGNDEATSIEELEVGAAGANYGWPDSEGPCSAPCTSPIYSYPHLGRDAAIVSGFVYHGSQFPSAFGGSFFFADYAQNWIKRLTFDASGNVNGVYNFEPINGSSDGPTGDIVYLTEGPDGALYYVDLGFADTTKIGGVSKIRRISYSASSPSPVAVAAADPTSGPAPLAVTFSSAGSFDPDGQPITFLWTFGDGTTSSGANPSHTYTQPGEYVARLSVSDGTNTSLSAPITIIVGNPPTATILSPQDGSLFRAGDVISFSGDGTDPEDGSLPASAFTWNIDFLHEGHIHPGTPITGVKSGSFVIPTSGHDFSGNTRYRVSLTVTDADGLSSARSVIVYPDKVNLSFGTVPAGLTLYLDGIAKATPFVYDTLIDFHHTIEARNQTAGATNYTFASWSDGGGQLHELVAPPAPQTYTATYTGSSGTATPTFVQVNSATPQTSQTTVTVPFSAAQIAGDTNVLAIGWNDATSNISSVTDSAGNVYALGAPIARGTNLSQAIYYAKNITAAPAGANTVTVTFSTAVPFADIRILEYGGLDAVNPLDTRASASGTSILADSGPVTTTSASSLIFGAGMTRKAFKFPGAGFTKRIITKPDSDIAEDRMVTSVGSYNATAQQGSSGAWVMQVVAFRAAGQ